MKIDLFSYSDKGARELNEDSYCVLNSEKRCVAVLCDGLGGVNCGEVASNFSAKAIAEGLAALTDPDSAAIGGVIGGVNDVLCRKQVEQPQYKGMRTTAVGVLADGAALRYFNSGDSRFYLFSNGAMRAMTRDHSVPQMRVDLGELRFEDIRFASDRNRLLKVLGEECDGEVATVYQPEKVQPGDAFLLCSDGFWEYVTEDEMVVDLSKASTAQEWIEFMLVRLLLQRSKENDNFTVIGGIVR